MSTLHATPSIDRLLRPSTLRVPREPNPPAVAIASALVQLAWAPVDPDLEASGAELSAPERERLATFSDPRRRATFLAGRHAARRAIGTRADAELTIVSWLDDGRGARPAAYGRGRSLVGALAIAHTDQWALAAWRPGAGPAVGVDLISPNATLRPTPLWFDDDERHALRADASPPRRAAEWFGAKEAAFKATGRPGQPFTPRAYRVVSHADEAPGALRVERRSDPHRGTLLTVAAPPQSTPTPDGAVPLLITDLDRHD